MSSPNNTPTPGIDNRLLIIGGAVVAVLLLGGIAFGMFGGGGAAPTPTPTVGLVAPFVGPVWQWTGTTSQSGQNVTVTNPSSYTIQFAANNSYSGKADCNSFGGTYTVNGAALTINPGQTTLVGCPAGSQGDVFVAQLGSVESWFMQGTELTLNLKGNAGAMHLQQQGAPTNASVLVGPVWKWQQTQFNSGSPMLVPDPNQYTLQFTANGQVQIQADCNKGGGTYTTGANNALTIQIQQITAAQCAPGSLSQQFLQQLPTTNSFFTGGPDLVLNIQSNTGKMMFTSQAVPTSVVTAVIVTTTPLATPLPATITPTPVPSCPGLPQIQSFIAENPSIQLGQNTVLRWGPVTNATSVAIDQGIGGVATPGSTIVAPKQTTTYTLTATGCGGTTQAVVTVNVVQPTGVPTPTPLPTAVPPTAVPPTAVPTQQPTAAPTQQPTEQPTEQPTAEPTTQPGADLTNATWKWTGAAMSDGTKLTPSDPSQYTAVFNANDTLNVKADCNNANGSYNVNGSSLQIQLGAVTGALCSPDSLSQQFLGLLPQAATYSVEGSTLLIQLQANAGTMSFSK